MPLWEVGVPIGQTHKRSSAVGIPAARDTTAAGMKSLLARSLPPSLARPLSDTYFPGADYAVPFHAFVIRDAPPLPPDPALICSFAAAGDSSGGVGRR